MFCIPWHVARTESQKPNGLTATTKKYIKEYLLAKKSFRVETLLQDPALEVIELRVAASYGDPGNRGCCIFRLSEVCRALCHSLRMIVCHANYYRSDIESASGKQVTCCSVLRIVRTSSARNFKASLQARKFWSDLSRTSGTGMKRRAQGCFRALDNSLLRVIPAMAFLD